MKIDVLYLYINLAPPAAEIFISLAVHILQLGKHSRPAAGALPVPGCKLWVVYGVLVPFMLCMMLPPVEGAAVAGDLLWVLYFICRTCKQLIANSAHQG